MRRSRCGKGFTLLELLIVVVILAVLAGLALPQYLRTIARAKEGEGWQMLAAIRSAMTRYYAEFGDVTNVDAAVGTSLDIDDPNDAPKRMFDYSIAAVTANTYEFTITATPTITAGNCAGCRTLTLDQDGGRTGQ